MSRRLIEIGDGFRIPDILERSGSRLREVGSTNKTRLEDYRAAIGPDTRLLLRVHPSNFRIEGFTGRPDLAELVRLAAERALPLVEDLGSGSLWDLAGHGVADEPPVTASLAAGVSLATFSGDKLLGGPQAGIIAGDAELVARVRRNPLFRALRADKLIHAALEATLREYLFERYDGIPTLRMARTPVEAIEARAQALAARLDARVEIIDGESLLGGGSTPAQTCRRACWRFSRRALQRGCRAQAAGGRSADGDAAAEGACCSTFERSLTTRMRSWRGRSSGSRARAGIVSWRDPSSCRPPCSP